MDEVNIQDLLHYSGDGAKVLINTPEYLFQELARTESIFDFEVYSYGDDSHALKATDLNSIKTTAQGLLIEWNKCQQSLDYWVDDNLIDNPSAKIIFVNMEMFLQEALKQWQHDDTPCRLIFFSKFGARHFTDVRPRLSGNVLML